MMTVLPYVAAYLGLAIFLVACVARFVMWSRMPIHMRWELYPVAHEPAKKVKYGGSFMEDTDWWTRPRETSLIGELRVMVPEILFLVALREHNRKLWSRSFPFHFGLYLVGMGTALMMAVGLLGVVAPGISSGSVGSLLQRAVPILAVPGLVLGLVGAIGLYIRRRGDKTLRMYSAPADYFNLLFFVVAFGVALAAFAYGDRDFQVVSTFVANLVTFRLTALPAEGLALMLPVAAIVLLAALTAYIPLTHMSHFIGKYFAYHAIRWNDEPNLPGSAQEKKIQDILQQPVTWAAPHIGADGRKSWADVATEETKK
jgi:nitrate reductase gamma subunit